jgi:tripartite-type tricarboxylate transporter receptor subunit TctC
MKKLIIAFFITASSVVGAADLTYYQLSSRTEPTVQIQDAWLNSLESSGISVTAKRGMGCGGMTAYQADPAAKLVYFSGGRYWLSLQKNETACVIDLDSIEWVATVSDPYLMCSLADSPIQNSDSFKQKKQLTIGSTGAAPFGSWVSDYNRKNHTTHKSISFGNSTEAAISLLAKDIQVAVLQAFAAKKHISSGKIKCFASTASSSDMENFSSLHPTGNKVINEYTSTFALGAVGLSHNMLSRVRQSISSTSVDVSTTGFKIRYITTDKEQQDGKLMIKSLITDVLQITKTSK